MKGHLHKEEEEKRRRREEQRQGGHTGRPTEMRCSRARTEEEEQGVDAAAVDAATGLDVVDLDRQEEVLEVVGVQWMQPQQLQRTSNFLQIQHC